MMDKLDVVKIHAIDTCPQCGAEELLVQFSYFKEVSKLCLACGYAEDE